MWRIMAGVRFMAWAFLLLSLHGDFRGIIDFTGRRERTGYAYSMKAEREARLESRQGHDEKTMLLEFREDANDGENKKRTRRISSQSVTVPHPR
jgi:hypothetical protein